MADRSASTLHYESAIKIAVEALKALLLLNGGAATALVALTDKHSGPDYTTSVLCFGGGALFATCAFVSAYFSQLSYANHVQSNEAGKNHEADSFLSQHKLWQKIATVLVLGSVLFGVGGMVLSFLTH